MGVLARIAAADGWLISGLGISVVFSGLAGLAILISNFPRALAWWNRQSYESLGTQIKDLLRRREFKKTTPSVTEEVFETKGLDDAEATFRMLTSFLGEPFKLPRVLELAKDRVHRPHSTINSLLLKGTIVAGSDGLFHWKNGGKAGGSPNASEAIK
jgi:hypothetical protein